jgi:4-hydroxy-tetrahydrodipicolinate reductase
MAESNETPVKVIVNGARGRMGSLAAATIRAESGVELVGETDVGDSLQDCLQATSAQVVVDFTHPSCVVGNTRAILEAGARPVVGTTGFLPQDIAALQALASERQLGGVIAPNFAIGAVLLMKFAAEASRYLPDVEIIEMHHNQKADAPSGTAVKTAELIAEQRGQPQGILVEEKETVQGARGGVQSGVRVHSVRLPGFVAHEEVLLGGVGQILSLRHDAISRDSFMPGVVLAVRKVMKLDTLVYGLEHILEL